MSPYDYGIAVHFEATCWEIQRHPKLRESEIIEFTAILFSLKTGKNEAEFHKYVKPTEVPTLSDYCVKLTGISQDNVNNGEVLEKVLQLFDEWLRKELTPRNSQLAKMSNSNKIVNVALIAWTDWEFDVCLTKECKRKSLVKAQYFNQYIFLRTNYQRFYKIFKTKFADAMRCVGFKGSELFGMDDVRYVSALTYKMVSEGAKLTVIDSS